MFETGRAGGGFAWEAGQDRMSLVTGFGVTFTDLAGKTYGLMPGAIDFHDGQIPTFDAILKILSDSGKVPAANRTNLEAGRFETLDGQLFMRRRQSRLEVNTPRTQGVSLLSGTSAKLPNLEVISSNADAAITLSTLDKADLDDSARMLLVISTDALNSDMAFKGPDRAELVSLGNTPALVKTGQFSLALTNHNTSKLRVWGLEMTGKRDHELETRVEDGRLVIDVDTTKLPSPYLFYEVAEE